MQKQGKSECYGRNNETKINIPRYLYHYSSFRNLENILANNTIYFQRPYEVNDPFDCKLHPSFGKNDEDRATAHLAWDSYRKRIGLFCLSEVNNDILMWSHYGDKHRGVVLQFDGRWLLNNFKNLKPVEYHEDWPEIGYYNTVWDRTFRKGFGKRTAELEELETIVFLRKALHWCYEYEWRIVLEENGFVSIDPLALTAVILGCKMGDADCEKAEEYRGKYGKENIELFKARECPNRYCLEIRPISGEQNSDARI